MIVGSIIVRVPAPGWKPQGYVAPATAAKLITKNDVFVYDALKTPQFWLIWWVLCLNVTAGIGVLGQASAMSQEMFPGHITPVAAAGFVGLMSLFNMIGRLDPKSGDIKLVTSPTEKSRPYGLMINSKGVPYFVEFGAPKIASIDPQSMAIKEYPLPDAGARPRRLAFSDDDTIWYTDFPRGMSSLSRTT